MQQLAKRKYLAFVYVLCENWIHVVVGLHSGSVISIALRMKKTSYNLSWDFWNHAWKWKRRQRPWIWGRKTKYFLEEDFVYWVGHCWYMFSSHRFISAQKQLTPCCSAWTSSWMTISILMMITCFEIAILLGNWTGFLVAGHWHQYWVACLMPPHYQTNNPDRNGKWHLWNAFHLLYMVLGILCTVIHPTHSYLLHHTMSLCIRGLPVAHIWISVAEIFSCDCFCCFTFVQECFRNDWQELVYKYPGSLTPQKWYFRGGGFPLLSEFPVRVKLPWPTVEAVVGYLVS